MTPEDPKWPSDDSFGDEGSTSSPTRTSTWWRRPDARRRSGQVVRIAAVCLVVLVALFALGVTTYDRLGGSDDSGDSSSSGWPPSVNGRPAGLGPMGQSAADVEPTVDPGVYLWSDFDGWHLWVVAGEGVPAEVNGSLASNDALASLDLAVPDSGSATLDGEVGQFSVPTASSVAGVDFSTGFYAEELDVTLEGPDGPLDATLIHVGSDMETAPDPLRIFQG